MKQLRRLIGLVWLSSAVVSAQTPGELIELRRELDTDGGVRLVVASTTPVLFDYSSPSIEEIVLRLHAIDPGVLVGPSQAWMPEVALEVARERDATGVTGTRLSIRLARFRRYRIRTEGNSIVLILLPEETAGNPHTPSPVPVASGSQPTASGPDAPAALEPPAPEPAVASPAVNQSLADTRDLSLSVGSTASSADPAPGAAPATRVLGFTQTREADSLTVRIETDGTPTHRVFALQGPERLVLDLIGMQVDPPQQRLEVGSGGIVRVRLAQNEISPQRVVRLVVDLEAPLPHRLVVGARSIEIIFATR